MIWPASIRGSSWRPGIPRAWSLVMSFSVITKPLRMISVPGSMRVSMGSILADASAAFSLVSSREKNTFSLKKGRRSGGPSRRKAGGRLLATAWSSRAAPAVSRVMIWL